jgi:hypothetical protein
LKRLNQFILKNKVDKMDLDSFQEFYVEQQELEKKKGNRSIIPSADQKNKKGTPDLEYDAVDIIEHYSRMYSKKVSPKCNLQPSEKDKPGQIKIKTNLPSKDTDISNPVSLQEVIPSKDDPNKLSLQILPSCNLGK